MSSSLDRYRTMATDDLTDAYRELGGLARAVEVQRLLMLQVLIEREAYRLDGCLDAGQWVAATDMVPAAAARAAVDTAGRLGDLPAITAAAEAGRLSMAQLVPLAELADPSSDGRWAEQGPAMSPAALLALVRERRQVSREDAERQRRRWTITGDPAGTLEFHRPPWGTTLPVAPTPAPPELRHRYGLDAA